MTSPRILPVILSGGVGSRLWPLSREAHPKPFIKLDDGRSLIQKTYERAASLTNFSEVLTVTNRDLFFYTKDEYAELDHSVSRHTFLLEPVGRNTTAAIAVAAQYATQKHGNEAILLILPADHLINNTKAFAMAVDEAAQLANQNQLVTFGIQPNAPETGFGYIQASGNQVTQFVEKPNRETAESYLASGDYLWNSGMFCLSANAFLSELTQLRPDIAQQSAQCFSSAKQTSGEGHENYELPFEEFSAIEDISIDYAVFEKSKNVAIVPCDIGWSDIGSWKEFGALHPTKDSNNIHGEVILEDTYNCIVHGDDKLVATIGLNDLIIADTSDALLVAHKDRAQDVRTIVSQLKASDSPIYREFPTVHRPWGTYTTLQESSGFKLKWIEVKPGARLSLQSHKHRSEHWVIVSGRALVTNGDEQMELSHNESTYIPAGHKHRLENLGEEMLTLIEVQCGSYLGEDDIIRYDDIYGRAS